MNIPPTAEEGYIRSFPGWAEHVENVPVQIFNPLAGRGSDGF
jgi:hypothetical protein